MCQLRHTNGTLMWTVQCTESRCNKDSTMHGEERVLQHEAGAKANKTSCTHGSSMRLVPKPTKQAALMFQHKASATASKQSRTFMGRCQKEAGTKAASSCYTVLQQQQQGRLVLQTSCCHSLQD
eukprot:1160271-Pelagomonas_calceolata.AAC.2